MTAFHSFTKGDPAHPTVVLVHGILGSSRNLLRLAEAIAVEGFHVLAYDQRGHGHSEHNATGDFTVDGLADDLFQVLDGHGISSAHLVGHSLGGRVCLRATTKKPLRVKSLSMLDVGVRIHPNAYETIRGIIESLKPSYSSRQEAEQALAQHGPQVQSFLLSNLRSRQNTLQWIFDLEGIRSQLLPSLTLDQTEQYRVVECPILAARGAKSEHFTPDELLEMERLNSRTRVGIIPKAGHWVHADNFEGTRDLVLDFLRSSSRIGAGVQGTS